MVKLAIFGLLCLQAGSPQCAFCATPSHRPLNIHVQEHGFGSASPAEIATVSGSAGSEIWKYCPRTQLDGIEVYRRTDHPQTDFKRTLSGRFQLAWRLKILCGRNTASSSPMNSAMQSPISVTTAGALPVICQTPTSGWRKAFAKRLLCSFCEP